MKHDNIYLAIPKAVIRRGELFAYSNERKKIYNTFLSEPLGFFLVRPIKRLRIIHDYDGGQMLSIATVGFAEIKTGKRIITRTFMENEEGNTEAIQHDILADIVPSTGDIEWSIDYNPVAIKNVSDSKIKEYMKLSKSEIVSRLNDIHIEAKVASIQNNMSTPKKMVKTL